MSASPQVDRSISIVIPVYNEEGSLGQLHKELCDVASQENLDIQIVMIDDGSSDRSWEIIDQLSKDDSRVLGIRFRRNFGKAAGLRAGFDRVTGDVIVMMDADLQDTPAELPKLLAKLDEGNDVVSGWKLKRHDPWHKTFPSKGFNALVGWLSGVKLHDHNCGFKCFKREIVDEIDMYGERHRFIPVLAAAQGFRVDEVAVEHRPRTTGESKYGWSRIPKGFLDLVTIPLVTQFRNRPQHWLGSAGLISLLMGAACMVYLAFLWVFSRMPGATPVHLHETAALYYSMVLVILGAQFLAIGLVAELIVSIAARDQTPFSISETTDREEQGPIILKKAS